MDQNPLPPAEPNKQLTDEQAQSLLAINSLQTKDSENGSKSFLYIVISITVAVIILSLFLQHSNNEHTKSTGSTTSTSQNNSQRTL